MKREDIPVLQPISAQVDTEAMARVAKLRDTEPGWLKERMARHDTDRLSFLDGQRAYIEIGETGAKGSGYVYRNPSGWTAGLRTGPESLYLERDDFKTLRDALDYLQDEAENAR